MVTVPASDLRPGDVLIEQVTATQLASFSMPWKMVIDRYSVVSFAETFATGEVLVETRNLAHPDDPAQIRVLDSDQMLEVDR